MNLREILLVAVALIPAIFLCRYVYKKDRVEKEPVGFLLLLMFLGALTAFPVIIVSDPINGVIDGFFTLFAEETEQGLLLNKIPYHIYLFVSNTVGVACIEEGFKWLVLFFVTRNSKHFNSYFDGVIYAVFVSLGFAAFENVLYSLDYGFSTAVIRAFTAVPGHMFDGVIMGTFYSMWNVKNEASKLEKAFADKGVIRIRIPIRGTEELVLSYVMPVLAHGAYDYLCSVSTWVSDVLFVILLVVLYVTQFKRISSMSKEDADEKGYAISLVCKKYVAVKELIDAASQNFSQAQEKPVVPVKPVSTGIRRTHGFDDFEFEVPKYPQRKPESESTSDFDADEIIFKPSDTKRKFRVYIDESDFTDT